MIQYTIRFELYPSKENEFSLSWNSFYENTKGTDGLSICKISDLGKSHREIEMIWKEQYYLNLFMKGEWYNFLQGAIAVLGDRSIITQRDVETEEN
ncbi:MAG: hypothetical protein QNK35_08795 [Bacteroides sp.]|nr:hypothetical protein [Bacteroides sp.]